jgi:3-dehydroquinate dehydratase/shikimate dehydrogenase
MRELGIAGLYVPFQVDHFSDFWMEVVDTGVLDAIGFPLMGLAVTAPWKSVALAVAGAASPLAERVGAANTLTRRDGVWEAESTDGEGLIRAFEGAGVALTGARALVVGAGGAGRSAAFALAQARAQVSIANRTSDRGRALASDLGAEFVPWEDLELRGFDVVVQATSQGREGDPVLDPSALDPGTAVLDLVYRSDGPTPLVAAARARGLVAIDGREVLLAQARGQFRLAHGVELPLPAARRTLGLGDDGRADRGLGEEG